MVKPVNNKNLRGNKARAAKKKGAKRNGGRSSYRKVKKSARAAQRRGALEAGPMFKKWRKVQGVSKQRAKKRNPAAKKLKRVTKSTGWLKADAVRFVKKRGGLEVYLRRGKPRRRK